MPVPPVSSERLRKAVREYAGLLASQEGRGLLKDQQQQLDLLRELMTESGVSLDPAGWPQPPLPRFENEAPGPRPVVCLLLSDSAIARPVAAVLLLTGHSPTPSITEEPIPMLLVADTDRVIPAVQRYPATPLVLVNVSGPDALMGKLSALQPAAFVKRPASVGSILEAIHSIEARLPGGPR